VPCGPVNTVDAVASDPHVQARDMLTTLDVSGLGPTRTVNSPLRLSRTPAAPAGPPPRLGEHTDTVLARYLALTPADLAALRAAGAIA
jgi:crotonobetainyl-CoA:carnitine CoA-transferase CaiB-like acyl-CoA transferase